MKKLRGIIVSILLCVSLCACGGAATGSNAGQGGGAASPSGNAGNSGDFPLKIMIKSDTEAEIVFLGNSDIKDFSKVTGINVSFGKYSIGLNDFGGESLQCSIWYSEDNKEHKLVDEGKARYEVGSDRITLYADMKDVAGFSFKDVSGAQQLHYEYGGNGGPDLDFDWSAVADMTTYSAERKSESASSKEAGASFAAGQSPSEPDYAYHFWFMDHEYTTGGGIKITFSKPFVDGAPTKVTIKGAQSIKDGTYDFEVVSCTGVDDDKEGFVQGKILSPQLCNIKTEIRTDDGRVLMVDIYT